jgi:catechol 2,3-dioxygenase-like lactoylglutathione lyase family enzyme
VFERVTLSASDRAASERFYRTVLHEIGIEPDEGGAEAVRWRELALEAAGSDAPPTRGLHLAFVAPSRAHVDAFWRAGVDAGYDDAGAPGERAQYRPDYYGAFLLDPDGNSAEAVRHGDVRRGGHLDHLWIGVRDLAAAEAFYVLLAPHTGLREGRRWEHGVQFRGAWATMSLVADGRPPSEGLRLAFPAPERASVDDFYAAALTAGAQGMSAPGERGSGPGGGPRVYSARVLDRDGARVESVARGLRW